MKNLQKVSGFLSLACAIHCLAMPILLLGAASSSWLAILENPVIEIGLLVFLLPICIVTLLKKPTYPRSFLRTSATFLGILLPIAGLVFHLHYLLGLGGLLMAWVQLSKPRQTCCHKNSYY